MSFLKQPFDFLIDRDDMIDVTFPGYHLPRHHAQDLCRLRYLLMG